MPYKSEKIPIAGTMLDRRRKLSDDKKKAIKVLSEQGFSQREIAVMFGCSRWTIQNVLQPQKRCLQPKHSAEYWTLKKREYRLRKQKLFLDGVLTSKTNKHKKQ